VSELPVIPNYLEPCIANVFFHKVVLGELVIDSVLAETVCRSGVALQLGLSSNLFYCIIVWCTGLSKMMDGIWNRYNLKSTGRIYTFGVLKCSEKFKVLDLP